MITYELAKELKEKGFPKIHLAEYFTLHEGGSFTLEQGDELWNRLYIKQIKKDGDTHTTSDRTD